jgi:hypothetical protein
MGDRTIGVRHQVAQQLTKSSAPASGAATLSSLELRTVSTMMGISEAERMETGRFPVRQFRACSYPAESGRSAPDGAFRELRPPSASD